MAEEETKSANQSGYAKMDKNRISDHGGNYHRHHGLGIIFGVLIFILFFSFVFALGRASNRRFLPYRAVNTDIDTDAGHNYRYGGMMSGRGMMRAYGRDADGIIGQISNINGSTLTIKDTDGTDHTVNIAATTSIIINGKIDKVADLKTSGQVVISGNSNSDGSINATIIRCLQ